MATITALGGPWEPDPALRAMLASIARTQKQLAPILQAQQQMDRQLAPLLSLQRHEAGISASLAAARRNMRPLLVALDLSGFQQLGLGMPSLTGFPVVKADWERKSEQLLSGVRLLRTQAPPELSFPLQTFSRAESVLDALIQDPPGQEPETLCDELTAETEALVEDAVREIEPVLRSMAPAKAKATAVAFVSVLVFLLAVNLSTTHPEAAGFITQNTGADPLVVATGAGWLTGKVWDRLFPQ